jgi:predicted DCC family thiol-disulfide oxidoreductase YuxK
MLLLIPRTVRDWGYRLVARNRKRLVKSETCGLPEEGLQEKLVR